MPLIAYDDQGRVIATLDYLVRKTDAGKPYLVNFAKLERAGTKLRELWNVDGAAGSGFVAGPVDITRPLKVKLKGTRIQSLIPDG